MLSSYRARAAVAAFICAAAVYACGSEIDRRGSDDDDGSAGNGTAGNGTAGNGTAGNGTAGNAIGGSGGMGAGGLAAGGTGNIGTEECTASDGEPTGQDCVEACDILFCCAEPRCDGLTVADEGPFRADCEASCATMMALVAVVNGANCDQTVATIQGVSVDFTDTCDNGL